MKMFCAVAILLSGAALATTSRGMPALQGDPPRGRIIRDCPLCPELVVVPDGVFRMGSEDGPPEEMPAHAVWVQGFAIGRYKVTIGEFAAYVEAVFGRSSVADYLGRQLDCVRWVEPDLGRGLEFGRGAEYPVACVDSETAQVYVDWLTQETGKHYRLPK